MLSIYNKFNILQLFNTFKLIIMIQKNYLSLTNIKMILLEKQLKSYEMEINSIKNSIKIDEEYYENQKQSNITWAKNYNNKIFKRVYDKCNNLKFKCKICLHKIDKIPVYRENLHNDEYIKCPHCGTTRYLDPFKIANRINKNLDKEHNLIKSKYLKKLKVLELNLKCLKDKIKEIQKRKEEQICYYL